MSNYTEYLEKLQREEMQDLLSPYRIIKTESQRLRRLEQWKKMAEAS